MVAAAFPPGVMNAVASAIHADRNTAIQQLLRFVAIKSDSVSKKGTARVYVKELREAAEMLAAEFRSLGWTVTFECNDTDTPIVCVSYDGAGPDAPTLGGYGHYDVQPEGEGWTVTSAFAPVVLDGYLFGRGSGDMKGPICALLHSSLEIAISKK